MVTIESYYDYYCMWWWLHNTISVTSRMNMKWLIAWWWLHDLYRLIMNKTTSFSPHWLSDPEFSGWIGAVPDDKHRARCIACGCAFDLSNMGKRALQSHATGKKHQKALALMVTVKKEQNTLHSFFSKVPKAIPIHDTALAQEEIPDAVPPDLHVAPPPPLTVQQSAASTTNGSKQQCVLKVSSGDVLRCRGFMEHKGGVVPLLCKQLHRHARSLPFYVPWQQHCPGVQNFQNKMLVHHTFWSRSLLQGTIHEKVEGSRL